jgi:hypothetical protein
MIGPSMSVGCHASDHAAEDLIAFPPHLESVQSHDDGGTEAAMR